MNVNIPKTNFAGKQSQFQFQVFDKEFIMHSICLMYLFICLFQFNFMFYQKIEGKLRVGGTPIYWRYR